MLYDVEEVLKKVEMLPRDKRLVELGEIKAYVEDAIKNTKSEKSEIYDSDDYIVADPTTRTVNEINRLIEYGSNFLDELDVEDKDNYISLFELNKYLNEINSKYNKLLKKFNKVLTKKAGSGLIISCERNFYEDSCLSIEVAAMVSLLEVKTFSFNVKYDNGVLNISEGGYVNKLFNKLYPIILDYYESVMHFKDYYYNFERLVLSSVNSYFNTRLFTYNGNFEFKIEADDIQLLDVENKKKTIVYGNSYVISTLKDREDELLKNTYIRISDLPLIFQKDLKEKKEQERNSLSHKVKTLLMN